MSSPMRKTMKLLDCICACMNRELKAHCISRHAHGDIMGTTAVAMVSMEFPDGSKYLVQVTKLL